MIQEHEFPEAAAGNRCKHCGGLWMPQMTATCLQREIPPNQLMPEPKRREYACESDEIAARIAELRAAADEARNHVSE